MILSCCISALLGGYVTDAGAVQMCISVGALSIHRGGVGRTRIFNRGGLWLPEEASVNWGTEGAFWVQDSSRRNGSLVWQSRCRTRPPLVDPRIGGRWEDEVSERELREEGSARRRKEE